MSLLDSNLNIIPLNIFIDPQFPVDKAIITHAHADHAKPGHKKVLGTRETLDIMKLRYGKNCASEFQIINYNETINYNGIKITFFPAGHILGSAQILIENKNERVVVTGDFKTTKDSTAEDFELVNCSTLVTEATFGLPIFKHPDPKFEVRKLLESVIKHDNHDHLIGVYALGKSQRLIKLLRDEGYDSKILVHRALYKICEYYQENNINLGDIEVVSNENENLKEGRIILAPPSALKDKWSRRFKKKILSQASGWMCVKQRVKQSLIEIPLVISDHADWNELTNTVLNSNAERVWVTHGREDALVYWSRKKGLYAKPLSLKGREEN